MLFCSSVSALLGFVIVFNLSFNAFHLQTEEHHHAEQNCSVDEEFDACHRFLIHHEKSAGCDGTHQHITKKADSCFACNFFKNQQETTEPTNGLYFSQNNIINHFFNRESRIESSSLIYTFLRGPPSIS